MTKSGLSEPRKRQKPSDIPDLSKEIRDLRIEAKLTQKKLAKESGISEVTISRIESGDFRISARNLEKLLRCFNLTLSAKPLTSNSEYSKSDETPHEDTYEPWK